MESNLPGPAVHEFSGQVYWSGLSFPTPELGTKPYIISLIHLFYMCTVNIYNVQIRGLAQSYQTQEVLTEYGIHTFTSIYLISAMIYMSKET